MEQELIMNYMLLICRSHGIGEKTAEGIVKEIWKRLEGLHVVDWSRVDPSSDPLPRIKDLIMEKNSD